MRAGFFFLSLCFPQRRVYSGVFEGLALAFKPLHTPLSARGSGSETGAGYTRFRERREETKREARERRERSSFGLPNDVASSLRMRSSGASFEPKTSFSFFSFSFCSKKQSRPSQRDINSSKKARKGRTRGSAKIEIAFNRSLANRTTKDSLPRWARLGAARGCAAETRETTRRAAAAAARAAGRARVREKAERVAIVLVGGGGGGGQRRRQRREVTEEEEEERKTLLVFSNRFPRRLSTFVFKTTTS